MIRVHDVGWRLAILTWLGAMLIAPVTSVAQQPKQDQIPTIRATSEVVNVYAVVRDKKRPVTGLNKEDFELTEDNARQEIKYFSRETDTPLTMGILIDTSPSQQRVLPVEQQEADQFIGQVIGKRDLAFVLRFDVDVELLQDLTANHGLLSRAIDSTVIGGGGGPVGVPGPFPGSNAGGTHLHDAVYLASRELLKNEVGRKVLILLTDGEDQGSKMKLDEAAEAAQKSDVIIYSIAIIDRAFYRGSLMGFSGDSVLKKYSDQTGGRVIEVNRAKDTSQAFQELAEELRTQYLLGYTPANSHRDGRFRKIKVSVVNHDYKVQARRGYYAATD